MPFDSTRSPGAHDRSSYSYKSPISRRRSSSYSNQAQSGSQSLPPILNHLSSYPDTTNSDSLLLPALSSLKVISPPSEPVHYPTPTSPSEMEFNRRGPEEPIEEHEWVYIFSEIIRQARDKNVMPPASEILFQAIKDSGFQPVWEDVVLPPGRNLRPFQDGFRTFPDVPGYVSSGLSIQRRMKVENIPGHRALAPKPAVAVQIGPSAGVGSPATQSPLATMPTVESQPPRRKRGRPSKKDTAARKEQQELLERQTKREYDSQMSITAQVSQGPRVSYLPHPPDSPTRAHGKEKRTPRAGSNNGSSGNSGSSSGRRKRRQQSKHSTSSVPPPVFAIPSVEYGPGHYGPVQSGSHQRGPPAYSQQPGGPMPSVPPRSSSIYGTSAQPFSQRQQGQAQAQQPPTSTQPETRQGQSRSEGKSRFGDILNEQ